MQKVLQAAVDSYNKWAAAEKFYAPIRVNDLRGIFYNKLLSEIRNSPNSGVDNSTTHRILNLLKPDDITCLFTERGLLYKVKFKAHERYANQDSIVFINNLDRCAEDIVFHAYSDPMYYEIADIVKRIENYKI